MRTMILLMLAATVAAAQKPKGDYPQLPPKAEPVPSPKVVPDQPPPPPAQPPMTAMETAIAEALRTHPDVKLAEAKRLVADAELEQARLAVTQRITAAFAKIDQCRAKLKLAEQQYALQKTAKAAASASMLDLIKAEAEVQAAASELAAAEAELQAAKGGAKPTLVYGSMIANSGTLTVGNTVNSGTLTLTNPVLTVDTPKSETALTSSSTTTYTPTKMKSKAEQDAARVLAMGKNAETLKTWLNKTVKIEGENTMRVEDFLDFLKKEAGSDITIRLPHTEKLPNLERFSGTHTVRAWLELVMDEVARHTAGSDEVRMPGPKGSGESINYVRREPFQIYVRDYGLLMTTMKAAPADALTLEDFVKAAK